MAWDGSGNFSRVHNWQNDDAANIDILATRMDAEDDNTATGIGACLTKNNESKPTATFNPNATRSYDLGGSSARWRIAYLGTSINVQSATAAVATTLAFTDATTARTVTFPDAGGTVSLENTSTGINSFSAGIGPNYIQNIGLTSSVASKALTIAIKTKALANASATDPVQIAFRNATLTTGDYVIRSITAATSVVAPSGATLGFAAAATGYVYIYALDNAGTVEAAVSGINTWDEATVQSTTAISATADSGSILYSTTARSNIAIRYIGRIKIATGAVAGEWDNEDTEIYVGNYGIDLPGALTSGIVIATTSGTSHDFTAIPSWVKRVTATLNGISTNGTSQLMIQIGDSGGIETSGYQGSMGGSLSNGFLSTVGSAAAGTIEAILVMVLIDAATNTWVCGADFARSDTNITLSGAGSKSLSGVLTTLRLTTVNGTDTFDAGKFNILYE
jgi:hypothetical protein